MTAGAVQAGTVGIPRHGGSAAKSSLNVNGFEGIIHRVG